MSNMSSSVLPERAIERLFARFGAMYGHGSMDRHWAGTPLEDVKAAWGEALSRFSLEDLLRGIRSLEQSGRAFPPSLPEFVALCRAPVTPPEHRPALPMPNRSREQLAAGAVQARALREAVAGPKGNSRAWARRVLERASKGDSSLAPVTIAFAKEALREELGS